MTQAVLEMRERSGRAPNYQVTVCDMKALSVSLTDKEYEAYSLHSAGITPKNIAVKMCTSASNCSRWVKGGKDKIEHLESYLKGENVAKFLPKPNEYRTFYLRFVDDYSAKETAEIMGYTMARIYQLTKACFEKLRAIQDLGAVKVVNKVSFQTRNGRKYFK